MPSPGAVSPSDKIAKIAQADRFLGAEDQSTQLENRLDRLAQSFKRYGEDLQADLNGRINAVVVELGQLSDVLSRSRKELTDPLQHFGKDAKLQTDDLESALKAIDSQVDFLARRFRSRLFGALESLSPQQNLFPDLLTGLTDFRHDQANSFPETMVRILSRTPDGKPLSDTSLFETEIKPALDEICRSTVPFVPEWRLYRKRLQLRGKYLVLRLPIRDMVQDSLVARSELYGFALVKKHEEIHRKAETRLADSWRAVRYHLDFAAGDLTEALEQLRSPSGEVDRKQLSELEPLVLNAMDRALEAIREVPQTYRQLLGSIQDEIRTDHDNALKAIRRGIQETGNWRGRWRWFRHSAKKAIFRRSKEWFDSSTEKWKAVRQTGSENLESMVSRFRSAQGPGQELDGKWVRISDLPTTDQFAGPASRLPAVYRRIFSRDPLISVEFLVGREAELRILGEALSRWQAGRVNSVAILGPSGSGKTSLLNCFQAGLDELIPVIRIDIPHRLKDEADVLRLLESAFKLPETSRNVPDLIQRLLAQPRQIVMVEQGHNLFLRVIGGRRAAEIFFHVLMETRAHFLWVFAHRLQSWMRLEYTLGISQFFTHEIRTTFHNEMTLREAILLRQRAIGDKILFSDKDMDSTWIRRLRLKYPLESEEVQKPLTDRFFSDLFDLSGGNMLSAMFFWIQSLRTEGNGIVQVLPCPRLDYKMIKELDPIYLFTLAELLSHGNLSAKEHSEIFQMEVLRSGLVLDFLKEIRLVDRTTDEAPASPVRYHVSPVFFQPVAGALQSMNILY
jgi:ABC-type dipeptide/oligopeptide/nickel transport system ATPase subunit